MSKDCRTGCSAGKGMPQAPHRSRRDGDERERDEGGGEGVDLGPRRPDPHPPACPERRGGGKTREKTPAAAGNGGAQCRHRNRPAGGRDRSHAIEDGERVSGVRAAEAQYGEAQRVVKDVVRMIENRRRSAGAGDRRPDRSGKDDAVARKCCGTEPEIEEEEGQAQGEEPRRLRASHAREGDPLGSPTGDAHEPSTAVLASATS